MLIILKIFANCRRHRIEKHWLVVASHWNIRSLLVSMARYRGYRKDVKDRYIYHEVHMSRFSMSSALPVYNICKVLEA